MKRDKSPECIAPSAFDFEERQQSAKAGIFNLISTMIGGGVLCLPYALSRSGLILGFIMLILSGATSVFSFDILVSSARRTGAMTYQQIAYFAFGSQIQHIINFLICSLTVIGSIAYCVLVGDLLTPIVCYLGSITAAECSSEWLRRSVILCGILVVSPFCFMRQIKALKYTSIISMTSVTILAAIITYKTSTHFGTEHEIYYIDHYGFKQSYSLSTDIRWFPQSFEDIIYVFPVFSLSFLCHFNIPQVHSELTRPTRRRMRNVLITVVLVCSLLYAIVSFFGYFYSFQYTCGNILLNYDQNDMLISAARFALSLVLLLSFPLLILPARSAMHNLLNLIHEFKYMNMEQNEDLYAYETSTMSNASLSKQEVFDSTSDDECVEAIACSLFDVNNKERNNSVQHNGINKLQVVNKNASSDRYRIVSPNGYEHSKSSQALMSQRAALSYNTFSVNASSTQQLINSKRPKIYIEDTQKHTQSLSALVAGIKKRNRSISVETDDAEDSRYDREVSYRSTSRGFTTRSFSHLDSPLREPHDALGIINQPQDIESLKHKDFTKSFQNIDDAKNYTPSKLWLIGETIILIAIALIVSFCTDSVMVLWAILGSTVSFLIAFTLPAMFYFKIRYHRKGWTKRNIAAVIIVFVSSIAIGLCTWQAILRLDAEPCPNIPTS